MFRAQDMTTAQSNKGQLMALGDFVFELSTLVYQQIERSNTWRHPGSEPVGAPPVYQYTGQGAQTLSFSGVIYKEFSNLKALDTLREMADTGQVYVLVSATGKVFGFYVIDDLSETQSYFDANGEPLRVEFTLKLTLAKAPSAASSVTTSTSKAQSKAVKA